MNKLILSLAVVAISGFASANEPAAPAAAPAAPAAAAAPAKKLSKKAATAACKKEGVKGKAEMKKCVETKTM